MPLQQGGEKSEGAGRGARFVGKLEVDAVGVASVVAHRHVEHGPRDVAFFLRPRRPDAALPVVVVIKTLQAIRRGAGRVSRVERIGLVVVAVAAGGIDRSADRTQVEQIRGVRAVVAHPDRARPEVLALPGIFGDRRVAVARGVPPGDAAVAVDKTDIQRVERIPIEGLERVPGIGPARGVGNDRVVADDAVQRGLERRAGQSLGRRVVAGGRIVGGVLGKARRRQGETQRENGIALRFRLHGLAAVRTGPSPPKSMNTKENSLSKEARRGRRSGARLSRNRSPVRIVPL